MSPPVSWPRWPTGRHWPAVGCVAAPWKTCACTSPDGSTGLDGQHTAYTAYTAGSQVTMRAFRSLSRAMFLGFIRDRTALIFTILIPVLFLVLLGSIYKSSATPKVTVLEVGKVSMLDQARAASPRSLGQVMKVTRTRTSNLAVALADVRKGTDD